MTIANARKFITRGQKDDLLRTMLNSAESYEDLYVTLEEEGLPFTPGEFEEAYTYGLTLCQFEEEADQLKEFRMWWELLQQFCGRPTDGASGYCSSSGTQCGTAGGCMGCGE